MRRYSQYIYTKVSYGHQTTYYNHIEFENWTWTYIEKYGKEKMKYIKYAAIFQINNTVIRAKVCKKAGMDAILTSRRLPEFRALTTCARSQKSK